MRAKFISILLFFSLTAPVVITFSILKVQQKQIKREVKWKMIAGLNDEELVLHKFSKKDKTKLKWKHSKEFEYKTQMFDVVKTIHKGDSTYYWCWWDHAETKLNKRLAGLFVNALGNDTDNQENKLCLDAFYKSLYFTDNLLEIETEFFPVFNENKFHYLAKKYFSERSIVIPPPKFCWV
jgi:hypothetical protein